MITTLLLLFFDRRNIVTRKFELKKKVRCWRHSSNRDNVKRNLLNSLSSFKIINFFYKSFLPIAIVYE